MSSLFRHSHHCCSLSFFFLLLFVLFYFILFDCLALCLLLQKLGEEMCTAIYLDELSVEELKVRVSEKYELEPSSIKSVTRVSKKGLTVRIDDAMLEHTEQDEGFQLEVVKDEGGDCSLIFRSL